MKKMRLHIYILLGVFLTTFILGSFFDLSISQALFSKNNAFGLVVSIAGALVGYSCIVFCAGGLFGLAYTKNYRKVVKAILYIAAGGAFVVGLFYSGREFFDSNGFTNEKLQYLGYLIALPFMGGVAFLGFLMAKRSDNENLLNLLIILMVAMFMSLVPGLSLLKAIFHRPRYRTLSDPLYTEITFHNWWERCTNYKDLIKLYSITSKEFKSFPSAHAGASMFVALTMAFAPMLDKRIKKNHLVYFYAGFAWTLLIAFSRILVGAHFLSDVSMGALITTIFMLITNEIVIFETEKYQKRVEQAE